MSQCLQKDDVISVWAYFLAHNWDFTDITQIYFFLHFIKVFHKVHGIKTDNEWRLPVMFPTDLKSESGYKHVSANRDLHKNSIFRNKFQEPFINEFYKEVNIKC